MFRYPLLLLSLLLGLTAVAPAAAQTSLPPSVEALVVLKVLAYDRALSRTTGDVVIAILYDPASSSSMQGLERVQGAMEAVSANPVAGRPVKVITLDASSPRLVELFKAQSVAAAYVTRGLDGRMNAIVRAAEKAGVITFGGNADFAERGGAVAVANAQGRAALVVNLPAARRAGADLTSAVLRVATVIQ